MRKGSRGKVPCFGWKWVGLPGGCGVVVREEKKGRCILPEVEARSFSIGGDILTSVSGLICVRGENKGGTCARRKLFKGLSSVGGGCKQWDMKSKMGFKGLARRAMAVFRGRTRRGPGLWH